MLEWASRRLRAAEPIGISDNPDVPVTTPEKPRDSKTPIALALGGGAARGWAHIGVLRALDEAGIEISMIAGTSIGALVGGCYLGGKLDQLEEFARSLTKRGIFSLLDLRLGGNGLFGGMKLDRRLREHLEELSIEHLSKRFIAVCTEINTGHEIWLTRGSLITAMRASYALPGVFEPVECNGRTLVDGALVNPVPVAVCRSYEHPLVVAVNLHYDQFGRAAVVKHAAEPPHPHAGDGDASGSRFGSSYTKRLGITGVMMEAFNIIQDRISRARMAGDPPDIMLMPKIGHVGLAEFHRADEAIKLGYEETMARLGELERMQKLVF